MIVSVLVSCLMAASTQQCEPGTIKKEIIGEPTYHIMGCMMGGQPMLPQWQQQNPNRKFLKIKCVDDKHLNAELGFDQA